MESSELLALGPLREGIRDIASRSSKNTPSENRVFLHSVRRSHLPPPRPVKFWSTLTTSSSSSGRRRHSFRRLRAESFSNTAAVWRLHWACTVSWIWTLELTLRSLSNLSNDSIPNLKVVLLELFWTHFPFERIDWVAGGNERL